MWLLIIYKNFWIGWCIDFINVVAGNKKRIGNLCLYMFVCVFGGSILYRPVINLGVKISLS